MWRSVSECVWEILKKYITLVKPSIKYIIWFFRFSRLKGFTWIYRLPWNLTSYSTRSLAALYLIYSHSIRQMGKVTSVSFFFVFCRRDYLRLLLWFHFICTRRRIIIISNKSVIKIDFLIFKSFRSFFLELLSRLDSF